jgi:hypothetical protein
MSAKNIRSYLISRSRAERIAFVAAGVALATGLAHLLLIAFDPSASWSGPTGIRKPAIFGFSIGLTLLSIAWLLRFFPSRPRRQTVLVAGMGAALLLEIAIIALQRFRGVPSHFNMATVLDGTLWSMMGLAIMLFAVLALVLTIWSFGQLHAPSTMRAAIRAGLLLLVVSQISGQLIVLNGTTVVLQDGKFVADEITRAATFGAAGNLKLPHAISLHGLQLLPLLGLLVTRSNLRHGHRWVWLSSAGFLGVAAVAQLQAYRGRAFTDLDPTSLTALGVSVTAFALPWIYAAVVRLAAAWHSKETLSCQNTAS